MNTKHIIVTALLVSFFINTSVVNAGGDDHGDEAEHQTEDAKGPHGGKLLSSDNFSVELTVFETGVPPEMRIFAFNDGKPILPKEWSIEVTLDRLGGKQDRISFSQELDYRVSNQSILEPHSYDVTVKATYQQQVFQWHYQSHEGRTVISDRHIDLADIKIEPVGAATLTQVEKLFGVIAEAADSVYRINAPYPGLVKKVHVQVGDKVKKGQRLLTLENTKTLQIYTIDSPASGEVTERFVNQGDRAETGNLLEIVDLSTVWVEMSAFPESIEKLAVGQAVTVSDLHHHESAVGTIQYVAPQMTGGHIARTRASITNDRGHWRPGMHVKSAVQTSAREVPLVIKQSALQRFRGMPVVFAKYGNSFEVRMVELGETNGDLIEVLGGIEPGTNYVTENSFLIKADILKSGASHDH